jgi:hypothetical protein
VREWSDFLLAQGGVDRDREMACGIQHEETALSAELKAASPAACSPWVSKLPSQPMAVI